MSRSKWAWKPEKFRHINYPTQPLDGMNPAPLLMKANSLEELKEAVTEFNNRFNYDDPDDYGLKILSSGAVHQAAIDHYGLDESIDWSKLQLICFYLPGGVCAELIEKPPTSKEN